MRRRTCSRPGAPAGYGSLGVIALRPFGSLSDLSEQLLPSHPHRPVGSCTSTIRHPSDLIAEATGARTSDRRETDRTRQSHGLGGCFNDVGAANPFLCHVAACTHRMSSRPDVAATPAPRSGPDLKRALRPRWSSSAIRTLTRTPWERYFPLAAVRCLFPTECLPARASRFPIGAHGAIHMIFQAPVSVLHQSSVYERMPRRLRRWTSYLTRRHGIAALVKL